jgi:hypothetical protein
MGLATKQGNDCQTVEKSHVVFLSTVSKYEMRRFPIFFKTQALFDVVLLNNDLLTPPLVDDEEQQTTTEYFLLTTTEVMNNVVVEQLLRLCVSGQRSASQ